MEKGKLKFTPNTNTEMKISANIYIFSFASEYKRNEA